MCLNTILPSTTLADPFTASPRPDNLKMFKTLLFVAAAVALASAAPADEKVNKAIVKLVGDGVTGAVTFTQQKDGTVRLTGTITGMPAGEYGFHIHETGDITQGCGSTGAHYNPEGKDHGHPDDENRHVGDLGNVKSDSTNTIKVDIVDKLIKLTGDHSIIGRGLVLHSGTDDFGRTDHPDSKKTGNAGGRAACGVIGILEEAPSKTNSASTSTSNILVAISMYSLIAILLN
ncbi:hypothetical protein PYW07_004115 [Mythimna separata]|uniref:Superoxide dismutase [Cu-Zn] n=1 Tax=Mythimna separata TaxID=271217 RepID=A0AAD7YQW8_MYTSE|nr:hypothetical protein PYW07_004115 [Mythimna separata]